jgi:hypothetical protein
MGLPNPVIATAATAAGTLCRAKRAIHCQRVSLDDGRVQSLCCRLQLDHLSDFNCRTERNGREVSEPERKLREFQSGILDIRIKD